MLVGDYGVLLCIAAQAYTLPQLVHCVDMVYPVSVNRTQKLVSLYLVIVNLTLRHLGNV